MQKVVKLIINEEYKKLLPTLSKQEYEALKQSIKTEGQHFPITINPQNIILDGHNRYKICLELGLEPKCELKTFQNGLLEKKFVIEANLRRRHLNKFQKAELGFPLLDIEKKLAKERQIEMGKTHGNDPLGSFEHKGKARDIVARTIGLSPITFQRALTIIEKAPEELKEKVRRGKTSITYAYKTVKREERHQQTPQLPNGEFDVVYADPPWTYDFPLRADPAFHYQTMKTQEICDLDLPISANTILFLWATNPKLEDALKVIKAWGFKYKTNMVWIKDKIGTGYYFRGQHELLLIATKGDMPCPTEGTRPASVLQAPRTEHSQKPVVVYEIIERMYPNRKYLELFARNKREGWENWGIA